MTIGLKGPIKHGKRGKGGNSEVANQNKNRKKSKGGHANMPPQHINFAHKKNNTSKKKKGKTRNARQALT